MTRSDLAPDPSGEWPGVPSDAELLSARWVTWTLTVLFAFVVLWEIDAPVVAGHYASSASMGIIADNMRTWGIAAPVWTYTATEPDPSLYYCHHPWGIFWTTTALSSVFGRSDLTCRLAAAVLSIMTVPLVSAIGRAIYRPLAGAAGAAIFVATPISLAFGQFNALEVPVMAWSALFLWGWARGRATGRRRHLAAMLIGAVLAMHADWPAFVLVAIVLSIDAVSLVAGRPRPKRRVVIAWLALGALAALSGLFYLWIFKRYGMLEDLLASYELRRGEADVSLPELVAERRSWDSWMLTRAFWVIAPLGALVACVRTVRGRRAVELAPVAVLAMGAFQYGVFRQGAWIHVFWPHYFALGAALAAAAIAAAAAPLAARLLASRPRLAGRGPIAVLVCVLGVAAWMARDALQLLVWARRTGGRFDEKGSYIETAADDVALLRTLDRELPEGARVGLHESMGPTWAHTWSLGGRVVEVDAELPRGDEMDVDVVVADARALKPRFVDRVLRCCSVRVVGPFIVVYPGAGPMRSEALAEREPAAHERLFGAAFEPVRTVGPRPFAGWLLAAHFGGTLPELYEEPETTEELAVAFSAALSAGRPERADDLKQRILARLSTPPIVYDDGTRLLGAEVVGGVAPRLVLVFAASGELGDKVMPRARARVVESPRLSLAPQPVGATRDLGPRLVVPPSRWKADWLYTATVNRLPRPGVEEIDVAFESTGVRRAPRPVEGGDWITIYRD